MKRIEVKEAAVGQAVVVNFGLSVFEAVVTAQNANGTTTLLRTQFGANVRPAKTQGDGFVVDNSIEVGVK